MRWLIAFIDWLVHKPRMHSRMCQVIAESGQGGEVMRMMDEHRLKEIRYDSETDHVTLILTPAAEEAAA